MIQSSYLNLPYPSFAEPISGLANSPEPARSPAFDKHFLALFSGGMDRPKSDNQQEVFISNDNVHETSANGYHLGDVNGLDVEIEFLEDKENRWDKIFELLENELSAQ